MIDNIFYLLGLPTCCGPEHLFRGLDFSIWIYLWVFPEIRVPQNGLFLMENPIKIDDLGVALFLETPLYDRQYLLCIRYFNMLWYIHIWNEWIGPEHLDI